MKKFDLDWKLLLEWCFILLTGLVAMPNMVAAQLGGGISSVGFLLRLWARGYQNIDLPTGPFRWHQYPMESGLFLIYLGLAIGSASVWPMLGLLIYGIISVKMGARLSTTYSKEAGVMTPPYLPSLWPIAAQPGMSKWHLSFAFKKDLDWIRLVVVLFYLICFHFSYVYQDLDEIALGTKLISLLIFVVLVVATTKKYKWWMTGSEKKKWQDE